MKMRLICCAALLAAGWARAQAPADGMGGYTSMEIDAGLLKGNFATGTIDEMTGGVKIRLLSDDPELKPLPIRAQTMKFSWREGQSSPVSVVMEQNVEVTHPEAQITADRAEWNFETGQLVLTGEPVVNNDKIKGLRGDKMMLNLKTNQIEVVRMRADQMPLKFEGDGGAALGGMGGGPALREGDVKDWAGLIDALRADAKAGGATPGGQVLSLIGADKRDLLMTTDPALLLQRKGDMVKLFNSVLKSPDLYKEAAWQGKTLPGEAVELLAADKRDAAEQVRLNRLLLSAAWPGLVAAP